MKYIFSITFIISFFFCFSQKTATDLVSSVPLFNGKSVHGSARALALGGVESPLGASVHTTVVNPAGLGLYRRSDFNMTIGLDINRVRSSFNNLEQASNSDSQLNKVSTNSTGVVFENNVEGDLVKGSAFAVTYNKLNDYSYEFEYAGRVVSGGRRNSLFEAVGNTPQSDYFSPNVIDFNTITLQTNNLDALAYWGYVVKPVDPTDPNSDYYIDHAQEASIISEKVAQSGSKNSWDFSYGINLKDKFFLGAGIGLAFINNRVEKEYSEALEVDQGDGLRQFSMRQVIINRGFGLNLKLGTIYRVNDQIRLSYAFYTATKYNMTEEYSGNIQTEFDSLGLLWGATIQTTTVNTRYTYKEPWKMNLGGAYFLPDKNGFVAFELDYQPYRKSELSGGTSDWSNENEKIRSRYGNMLNYKVGFESIAS